MEPSAPCFSVVIAASRPSSLGAAVQSIVNQTYGDWELIVIGQAEDADVRAAFVRAEAGAGRATYLRIPQRGLSRARNAGISAARGELIAMMDDDCEASTDWLAQLATIFQARPDVDFVGGSMLAPPKPVGRGIGRCPHWVAEDAFYDPVAGSPTRPLPFAFVGGNFAFRRPVADRVGPFDEHLGVGGTFPAAEDTDYLFRMEAHGVRMLSTPRSIVHHTDGWRYGGLTMLRHQGGRAIGNGALAAKRTMSSDPGGHEELRRLVLRFVDPLLRFRPPEGIWYLPNFWLGYRRCLRRYTIDERGLLRPRRAPTEAGRASRSDPRIPVEARR